MFKTNFVVVISSDQVQRKTDGDKTTTSNDQIKSCKENVNAR